MHHVPVFLSVHLSVAQEDREEATMVTPRAVLDLALSHCQYPRRAVTYLTSLMREVDGNTGIKGVKC